MPFRPMIIGSIFTAILTLLPTLVEAGPIYVYKEPDGSIRFTSKKPPEWVAAKVFTAKKEGFSIYKGRGFGVRSGSRLFPDMYKSYIASSAAAHGVDESLIRAVIHAESGYNPKAVSPKGAQGLMQLMPTTAREAGVRNPYDPKDNIEGGTKHLGMLIRKYKGNIIYALAAYNAGVEAVETYRGVPPYAETRDYVERVLSFKKRYADSNRSG